jgi:predicted metal-binding protein
MKLGAIRGVEGLAVPRRDLTCFRARPDKLRKGAVPAVIADRALNRCGGCPGASRPKACKDQEIQSA